MSVIKIIELVGTSPNSWEEAAKNAVDKAAETLRNITGANILRQNVVVKDGEIVEYRVDLKLAFMVEEEVD